MAEFSVELFPSTSGIVRRMQPWDFEPFKAAHEVIAHLISQGKLLALVGLTRGSHCLYDRSGHATLPLKEYENWLVERVAELDGPYHLEPINDALGVSGARLSFYVVSQEGDRTGLVLTQGGFGLPTEALRSMGLIPNNGF